MGIVFRELEADSIIIEEVDVRYISCANKEWLTNFFYEVLSQAEKGIHSFEEEPWLHRAASLIQYQSKKTNHATIRLLVEKVLACSEWMRAPSGKVIFVSLSEDKITRRLFE
jgi:DNA mismatch repair ATPase MutL